MQPSRIGHRLKSLLVATVRSLLPANAGLSLVTVVVTAVGCEACNYRSYAVGIAGTLFYALLTIIVFKRNIGAFTASALGIAVGVHTVLIFLLIKTGGFCILCIVIAFFALLAFIASSLIRVRNFLISVGCLLATQCIAVPIVRSLGGLTLQFRVPRGSAALILYEVKGCLACEWFRQAVLPQVQNEFGSRVIVSIEDGGHAPFIVTSFPAAVIVCHDGNARFFTSPTFQKIALHLHAILNPKSNTSFFERSE